MSGQLSDGVVVQSFEFSPNPDLFLDLATPACMVVRVNAALEALLGIHRERVIGRPCTEVLGLGPGPCEINFRVTSDHVVRCATAQRHMFWCRLEVHPLPDPSGTPRYALCTLHDISDEVELRRAHDDSARTDALTGLVRLHVFEARLQRELARAAVAGARIVVCYIDVDRFGAINELYAFRIGDQLLHAIADRIVASTGDHDLVARMGSNKFVAAFPNGQGGADPAAFGRRLATALQPPLCVCELSLRVTTSLGVASFPETGSGVQELLRQAAVAAHVVKRAGGDGVQVFVPAQRQTLDRHLQLGSLLYGAVSRDEMQLQYQPIVSASRREVVGMEALVRWHSPELGVVTPDEFIPLAEDLGVIAEIGRWVLRQACLQARRWIDQGTGDFVLSVNVSGLQTRDHQLLEDVGHALNAARLPARCLDLELTETAIMDNLERVDGLLGELHALGVKVSLDDFGVGQSSLGYLQHLQVNRLKIDRSFVATIPDDIKAVRICRAVIALAHEFGMSVIAEGVEHPTQLAFLQRSGCEYAQGYLFSSPVSADAMLGMLRASVLGPPELGERGDAGSDTVLLVDDEQNVLHALTRLLRRDGYRVLSATSFRDAFEILARAAVRVVISDHRMPDGNGTDFLNRVKAMHPDTARFILSGYADVKAVTEAINGGAVQKFLTKPWDDDALREVVREAMRAYSAR